MKDVIPFLIAFLSISCGEGICLKNVECTLSSSANPSTDKTLNYLVSDIGLKGLILINSKFERSVFSSSGKGNGDNFVLPTKIVPSEIGDYAFVIDSGNGLFKVDLETGDRTAISNSSIGTGPNFSGSIGLAVDSSEKYAYVTKVGSILKVDLTNGNRTILSDNSNGSGPNLAYSYDVAINSNDTKLFVADSTMNAIFSISI